MEHTQRKSIILDKEQKARFWALWTLGILCILVSIYAFIETFNLTCR